MRTLHTVSLAASLAFASGCGGCSFPFTVETDGQVVIPLGPVGDCSAADNGTYPENGEPDEDGNLTTYTHVVDGTSCKMTANWTGPLVNMKKAREDTEKELENQGLDPSTIDVYISGFAPKVELVTLRDDGKDGNPAIDAPGLTAYHGSIAVADTDDVITADFAAPGDPLKPESSVNVTDDVLAAVNEAYQDKSTVPASGLAETAIDVAQLAPVQSAVRPALVVDFKLKIEGEGTAGPGGE
jgi:hypothetical protein